MKIIVIPSVVHLEQVINSLLFIPFHLGSGAANILAIKLPRGILVAPWREEKLKEMMSMITL